MVDDSEKEIMEAWERGKPVELVTNLCKCGEISVDTIVFVDFQRNTRFANMCQDASDFYEDNDSAVKWQNYWENHGRKEN